MRTFAEFAKPLRQRLRALSIPAEQLTLVFDAGASSRDNLQRLEDGHDHYVTALRPSQHQALLAEPPRIWRRCSSPPRPWRAPGARGA